MDEKRYDGDSRDTLNLTREVETLSRNIQTQKNEYERTIKRMNEDTQRQLTNNNREPRVITSTLTDRSQE